MKRRIRMILLQFMAAAMVFSVVPNSVWADETGTNEETPITNDLSEEETYSYSVEFTYNDLTYALEGDSTGSLDDLIDQLGITGTVTQAESSSPEYFSVEQDDNGEWTISTKQAFFTPELLTLIIDGVNYEIVVTNCLNVEEGSTITLACTQSNVVEDSQSWNTSNSETVELTPDGNTCTVTGLAAGKAVITCDYSYDLEGTQITTTDTFTIQVIEGTPNCDDGHTVVIDEAIEATCTTDGLTEGSHCSVCGTVITAQETVPALGHDYSTEVVEPTATEKGYTIYTCTRCGDSYKDDYTDPTDPTTVSIDPEEITVDLNESKNVTVTLGGEYSKARKISYDKTTSNAQLATVGSWVNHTIQLKITGKSYGTSTATINVLDYETNEVLATTTLTITVACSHNYVSEVTTEPTCTSEGEITYTCSKCGDSYTEVVEKIAHTEVVDPAVKATCTEDGLTEGSHCSVCGTVITAQETIPALGHNYVDTVVEPTGAEYGYTLHTCTRCGDSYKDEYTDPTNPTTITVDPEELVLVPGESKEVTVTLGGEYTKARKIDYAKSTSNAQITSVGTWVNHTIQLKITAKSYGTSTLTVNVLDYSTNEVIASTTLTISVECDNHDFTSEVTTEPTCTSEGVRTYTCSVCGKTYTESIEKIDHTIVTDERVEPTCTEDGLTEGSHCSVCGTVITAQESIPALGHDYQDTVIEPTATEQGYTLHTCTRCQDSYKDNYTDPTATFVVVDPEEITVAVGESTEVTVRLGGTYSGSRSLSYTWTKSSVSMETSSGWVNKTIKLKVTGVAIGNSTAKIYAIDYKTKEKLALTELNITVICAEHTYTDTVVAPTDSEQGYTLHTCSVCGYSYKDNYTDASLPFTDVPVNKWYFSTIKEAYELKLMTGKTDTIFDPTANMTRGQVAVVLYRMAGSPEVEYDGHFTDVPDGKYYSEAVTWAYQNGVVKGKTDTTFDPTANITRQELAIMLKRYVNTCGKDVSQKADLSTFADASNVSGYALDSMQWAVANGIIGGKTREGTLYLDPKANATRAECCKMLLVAYHLIND